MKSKLPHPSDKKIIIHRNGAVFSKRSNSFVSFVNNKTGHLYFSMGGKNHLVRTAVAQLFVPNPHNHPLCIPINGDKTDTRAKNILWVSDKDSKAFWKRKKRKKKPFTRPKWTTARRQQRALSTSGVSHYKFKGYYCKNGAAYPSTTIAARITKEDKNKILKSAKANINGWTFTPKGEPTPEPSTLHLTVPSSPEAIF